jgi:hypothetical protein
VAPQDTQFCSNTIVLPLEASAYPRFIVDNECAQSLIETFWSRYLELFPIPECEFRFYGRTPASKKCEGMRLRRIKVQGCIYRIRPSFLLSYFRGHVAQDHLSDAMFLRKFGVPYWALVYLYGRVCGHYPLAGAAFWT